jgi:hypothetical protein
MSAHDLSAAMSALLASLVSTAEPGHADPGSTTTIFRRLLADLVSTPEAGHADLSSTTTISESLLASLVSTPEPGRADLGPTTTIFGPLLASLVSTLEPRHADPGSATTIFQPFLIALDTQAVTPESGHVAALHVPPAAQFELDTAPASPAQDMQIAGVSTDYDAATGHRSVSQPAADLDSESGHAPARGSWTTSRVDASQAAPAAEAELLGSRDEVQSHSAGGSLPTTAPRAITVVQHTVAASDTGEAAQLDPRAGMVSGEDSSGSVAGATPDASVEAGHIVTVSSAAELMAALSHATGGDTILLQSGDYGALNLYAARETFAAYASNVTIKSASSSDLAIFDSLSLSGVKNLTFDNIEFKYTAAYGAPEWTKPFNVVNSQHISITNSHFNGDLATGIGVGDGYGTGIGLNVSNSTDISVIGNEFSNWHRGAAFNTVQGLVVQGNEVHDVRSDGFDFAAVRAVLIADNYLHDFRAASGSGDHPDMIQFWTSGTNTPSTDIVIRSNVLDSGSGAWTQSIFMRNEMVDSGGAGIEMFYRNIAIENNVIYNSHAHGITVGETAGLVIRGNTILYNHSSAPDSSLTYVPTINLVAASTGVDVESNILPRLAFKFALDGTLFNNVVVEFTDPNAENYAGRLFVDALAGAHATLDDLKALPGGILDQLGVGSSLTHFGTTPASATGYILDSANAGLQQLTHTFDATNLFGQTGKLNLSGVSATWTFDDGGSAAGLVASHTFARAGEHVATANITLADGHVLQLDKTVLVQSPVAVKLSFDQGTASGSLTYEDGVQGHAVRLNGGAVTCEADSSFFNNREYSVSFDIKQATGAAGGYVAYFPYSFTISASPTKLEANFTIDGAAHTIKATGLQIGDLRWHEVSLTFSGTSGTAVLYLDGKPLGHVDGMIGGVQLGNTSHDLIVGSPFGASFDGLIDNFTFLRGAMDSSEVQNSYFDMNGALGPSTDEITRGVVPGGTGYTGSDWPH